MTRLIIIICIIGGAYFLVIKKDAPYRQDAINLANNIKTSVNIMVSDVKKYTNNAAKDVKKSTEGFTKDLGL